MLSQRETDRIFYEDTLAWARETGNTGLVDRLTELGPPPYEDVLGYESALSYEQDVYPYDHSRNSEGEGGFSENLFVEEYSLPEQVHTLGAFIDVFTILYPQLQEIDFRVDAPSWTCPSTWCKVATRPGGARRSPRSGSSCSRRPTRR
ncbi:MAG: hypothetical protein ACRDHS_10075 [Actinomycetota bacterium]